VESFCEEIAAPAQFFWVSHEEAVPLGATFYGEKEIGTGLISLKERGHQMQVKSWIPGKDGGDFEGMLVRHEECVTIAKLLEERQEGVTVYRPTVYFVYNQGVARESVCEFVSPENNYNLLPQSHIVSKDVTEGADCLGVFLLAQTVK